MKKNFQIIAVLSLIIIFLSGCTNQNTKETTKKDRENNVIKIAAHLPSMVDIINIASDVIKEDGYTLELVQVSDNIQYNELLNNKEVDANFAQHEPFMQKFNEEKEGSLVAVQKIYDAKVGFYSKTVKTLDDIPEGSKVALPSDVSNEGRALAILEEAGLITLTTGVGVTGTLKDVIDNPKKLDWLSVDLLNLAETYDEKDVSLLYNYPAYISKIGLVPKDAVILEKNTDQPFAISLVAREDNQDSPEIKALIKAMTSSEVRDFLEKEHSETLVPSF